MAVETMWICESRLEGGIMIPGHIKMSREGEDFVEQRQLGKAVERERGLQRLGRPFCRGTVAVRGMM